MSINNNRAKYILIKRQADYYGRDQSLQDGMQCCFQLHLGVLCPESLNEKSRHKFRRRIVKELFWFCGHFSYRTPINSGK